MVPKGSSRCPIGDSRMIHIGDRLRGDRRGVGPAFIERYAADLQEEWCRTLKAPALRVDDNCEWSAPRQSTFVPAHSQRLIRSGLYPPQAWSTSQNGPNTDRGPQLWCLHFSSPVPMESCHPSLVWIPPPKVGTPSTIPDDSYSQR